MDPVARGGADERRATCGYCAERTISTPPSAYLARSSCGGSGEQGRERTARVRAEATAKTEAREQERAKPQPEAASQEEVVPWLRALGCNTRVGASSGRAAARAWSTPRSISACTSRCRGLLRRGVRRIGATGAATLRDSVGARTPPATSSAPQRPAPPAPPSTSRNAAIARSMPGVVHVEVGDGAHAARAVGAHAHAACCEAGDHRSWRPAAGGARSTNTMFVSGAITRRTGRFGEALGQALGAAVVVGESRDVMVERVQARGREDADLAHAAAPALAHAARGAHVLGASRRGSSRLGAPRPFEKHIMHRVGAGGVVGDRDAGGDVRVPQPRAVQVHAQLALARQRGQLAQLRRAAPPRRRRDCACSRRTPASRARRGRRSIAQRRDQRVERQHAALTTQRVREHSPSSRPCRPARSSRCATRPRAAPRPPARVSTFTAS